MWNSIQCLVIQNVPLLIFSTSSVQKCSEQTFNTPPDSGFIAHYCDFWHCYYCTAAGALRCRWFSHHVSRTGRYQQMVLKFWSTHTWTALCEENQQPNTEGLASWLVYFCWEILEGGWLLTPGGQSTLGKTQGWLGRWNIRYSRCSWYVWPVIVSVSLQLHRPWTGTLWAGWRLVPYGPTHAGTACFM